MIVAASFFSCLNSVAVSLRPLFPLSIWLHVIGTGLVQRLQFLGSCFFFRHGSLLMGWSDGELTGVMESSTA